MEQKYYRMTIVGGEGAAGETPVEAVKTFLAETMQNVMIQLQEIDNMGVPVGEPLHVMTMPGMEPLQVDLGSLSLENKTGLVL